MNIELLAPAKDRICGQTAVNAGADAVYVGPARFGARRNAGNSVADVAALVEHAHRYQARVYATVNTVLLEHEFDDAVALVHQLHGVGVDAIIVQDLGLLEADLPPIPLIASTQTHAHCLERVQFLEAAGFSRVILARELSVDQIAQIRARTTIELEAFVHGALCVCYSGQCYLSHAIGGRSANRGECAQPCRKRYRLVDGQGRTHAEGYLLSMRDLNRIDLLGDLLDAGVTSFKIEGRLKDEAYVANTVAAYRLALDACLAARNLPCCPDRITHAFTPDLDVTFHRGYVRGFAQGDETMASLDAPKAIGAPVATARAIDGNTVQLDAAEPLSPGDGLCFFAPDGNLAGTSVQAVDGDTIVVNDASGIAPGTVLHRNHSREFYAAVKKGVQRRVPVRITLETLNLGARLTVEDSLGNRGTADLAGPLELPRNREMAETRWRMQLEKTGATEFVCEAVELEGDAPFVPVATMNDLRRRGLDALREARLRSRPRLVRGETRPVPCLPEVLDASSNITNTKSERLHRAFGAKRITRGPEAGSPPAGGRVMTSKYCLRRELGACLRHPSGKTLPTDLYLVTEDGKERLPLCFDCEACKMHARKR
ncbi:MAG: U32 family peptidase [Pirellulales bacterium]|nr:U32 family peptidase [Pirellulales bacterium]